MAIEDFTTYDETDEGGRVAVAASKVSWNNLESDETAHVSDSKGAAHFDGDFVHKFECQITDAWDKAFCAFWAVANEQQDNRWLINNGADFLSFAFYGRYTLHRLQLVVCENGVTKTVVWLGVEHGVTYFVTVTRDDNGGVNGTGRLTAEIRIDSHEGELKNTLSLDCSEGEQNDFEFIFALMGSDEDIVGRRCIGFTQNLDLQEEVVTVPVLGEPDQVKWRGVRQVTGVSGVWPARGAERVNEAQPQLGAGTKSLKTVPANKKLFISGGILSSTLSANGYHFVSLYVRDGEDEVVYSIMRHLYDIAGHQSTPFVFMPALEVAAGWEVIMYVEDTDLDAYCSIFGWQEDA